MNAPGRIRRIPLMPRTLLIPLLALLMSCSGSNGGVVDAGEDAMIDDGDLVHDHPGTDRAADGDHNYDDGGDDFADDGGVGDGDFQGDDAPAVLSLSSIDPTQGGASVPTPVGLSGTGFADGIEVYVGGVPATDVAVVSSVEATAVFQPVGPIDCGKKDVRVALGGSESTLTGAFEYIFDDDPVVFVHGYLMTSGEWDIMIQAFSDRGYPEDRLFAIDYSSSLASHITNARDELAPFVDSVLAQTGADRVDLVGHSSGAVSSRLLIAVFGGEEKVRDFVSVSGTHHGTQVACLGTWTGEAAEEMCPPYASEAESHNGMHWMLNCVSSEDGYPAAVLLRAIHPVEGIEIIRENRSGINFKHWCDGPAKLTRALGISGEHNGNDLCDHSSPFFIEEGLTITNNDIRCTPRIGIQNTPEPWLSKPWRYVVDLSDDIRGIV